MLKKVQNLIKISVFSSKMSKNWLKIQLNGQKHARIPKYFIKMIKKSQKSIKFSFFWSKMPKTWSKFHQNDQKTDRIQKYLPKMIKKTKKPIRFSIFWSKKIKKLKFSMVFCFNLVDFFISKKSQVYSPSCWIYDIMS